MFVIASIVACSSGDSEVISQPTTETPQPEEERVYRIMLNHSNLPSENIVFRTKSGSGQWIQQELYLNRFPIKHGDSLQIEVTNGYYIQNGYSSVVLEVHNRKHHLDDSNFKINLARYNGIINTKMKVEFPEFEDYPKWTADGNPIF